MALLQLGALHTRTWLFVAFEPSAHCACRPCLAWLGDGVRVPSMINRDVSRSLTIDKPLYQKDTLLCRPRHTPRIATSIGGAFGDLRRHSTLRTTIPAVGSFRSNKQAGYWLIMTVGGSIYQLNTRDFCCSASMGIFTSDFSGKAPGGSAKEVHYNLQTRQMPATSYKQSFRTNVRELAKSMACSSNRVSR